MISCVANYKPPEITDKFYTGHEIIKYLQLYFTVALKVPPILNYALLVQVHSSVKKQEKTQISLDASDEYVVVPLLPSSILYSTLIT